MPSRRRRSALVFTAAAAAVGLFSVDGFMIATDFGRGDGLSMSSSCAESEGSDHHHHRRAFLDRSWKTAAMMAATTTTSSSSSFFAGGVVVAGAAEPPAGSAAAAASEDESARQEREMKERLERKRQLQKAASKPMSYGASLQSERAKQASLKKTKEEKMNAMCEELGRGC